MLKIVGSLTSPFVRLVRIACEELGAAYETDITPPFSAMTEDQKKSLLAQNPLGKIPVLIDDGEAIIDSRVILHHLLKNYGKANGFGSGFPADMAEENRLTVIYGVIDAGILRYILSNSHPELNADAGYMARSLQRITDGFAWLDAQPGLGQNFGVVEAALICAIEWLDKRNVYKCGDRYSHLTTVYASYSDRPSVVKTSMPQPA